MTAHPVLREAGTMQTETSYQRLRGNGWPWLAYLIFVPFPWLWAKPDATTIFVAAVAVGLFLPLYLASIRVPDRAIIPIALAMLALGIAVAGLPLGWTTFCIYAGVTVARLRSRRHAGIGIAAIAVATAVTGLAWHQPILWFAPGVLFVVMSGVATMSSFAFYERTQALLASQEEVRRLAGTAERERITRDLHDVVGRTLTLVALKADLAGKLIDLDTGQAKAELAAIAEAARSGLAEVRAALAGQMGGTLAHETSASLAALETAGIEPIVTGDPGAVPADAGAVLAMTLREAVTNVIRHAGARRCAIGFEAGPGDARLVVEDDGVGLSFREGNGLRGMRQRLVAAGGRLELQALQPGTRLEASVPA
ncbi:sensor histidine kinase [Sphingomonas pituitosa]|uniref:sensor histidine kinase n=1 Tax=Sphingomonas pituitosa TaxID=99597 RepID=UPI001FDECE87|nr:histidine kinase [Sphingomonas pituitosa]